MLQSSKVLSYTDGGKLLLSRKKKLVCLDQSDATFDHPHLLNQLFAIRRTKSTTLFKRFGKRRRLLVIFDLLVGGE